MKTFTIWLTPGAIPENYQACIDTVKQYYPDHEIVTEWPNELAPYRSGNDRLDSDILRVWLLSQGAYDIYLDADCKLSGSLGDVVEAGKITAANAGRTGIPDIWFLAGDCDTFSDMLYFGSLMNFTNFWAVAFLRLNLDKVKLFYSENLVHKSLTGSQI